MQPIATTRHTCIVLAVLAIVSISTWRANTTRKPGSAPPSRIAFYAGAILAEAALLYFVARGLRITPRELIGDFSAIDIPIAAAFWFVARVALNALRRVLGGADSRVAGLTPTTPAEKIVWIALSLAAGIAEEFAYRGYLQRQFTAWTRSRTAGVLLQAMVFGLSHGYQNVQSMIVVAAYGLLFGLLALWRGTLAPGMLAHAATDIVGGLWR